MSKTYIYYLDMDLILSRVSFLRITQRTGTRAGVEVLSPITQASAKTFCFPNIFILKKFCHHLLSLSLSLCLSLNSQKSKVYVHHSPIPHQNLFTREFHTSKSCLHKVCFVFVFISSLIVFQPLFKRGLPRIPAGAACFSASSLESSHIYGHHLYSVWRDGILIRR